MVKRKGARRASGEGWALIQTCPHCGRDESACGCAVTHVGNPVIRLRIEKRRGKPMTVCLVEGLPQDQLRALAKELRTACGAGGTAKQDAIEVQGDHCARVREVLLARGYRVNG